MNTEFNYSISGLRPGEKLHEDMLAKTELPHTYVVPGDINLLSVRPQYTKRTHSDTWAKYDGKEFNSSLHVSNQVPQLQELIIRGLRETN